MVPRGGFGKLRDNAAARVVEVQAQSIMPAVPAKIADASWIGGAAESLTYGVSSIVPLAGILPTVFASNLIVIKPVIGSIWIEVTYLLCTPLPAAELLKEFAAFANSTTVVLDETTIIFGSELRIRPSVIRDLTMKFLYAGSAIAARIPIMETTIMSSISVKPPVN
jgi:hypothetical protein